jgi:hypothetical protein
VYNIHYTHGIYNFTVSHWKFFYFYFHIQLGTYNWQVKFHTFMPQSHFEYLMLRDSLLTFHTMTDDIIFLKFLFIFQTAF